MSHLDYMDLFYLVSNIPYGNIGDRDINACLKNNAASCSTKHHLLAILLEANGYHVKKFIGTVSLKKFGETLNPIIDAPMGVMDYHNFLALKLGDSWVKVDATFGVNEEHKSVSTNLSWDGEADCRILFPIDKYWEVDDIFKQKTEIIRNMSSGDRFARSIFFEKLIKYLRE